MHNLSRAVVAVVATTALVLAGLTGTALAAKPSGVGTHVKRSQSATNKFVKYSHKGRVSSARSALKKSRHEAVTAARQARSIAASVASNPSNADDAVWSITSAAQNFGQAIAALASAIPGIHDAALQDQTANAVAGSVAGHDQMIQILTDLVSQLTGDAKTLAAQALAALQAALPSQVSDLADVTAPSTLPDQIQQILETAVNAVTTAMNTALSALNGVLPELPSGVQDQIGSVISSITGVIGQVIPMVTQITSTVLGAVQGIVSNVLGIIGQVFGGGQSSSGDDDSSSSSHGGLLGGLMNLIPGFGGMFGNLFGGLLGGGLLGGI